VASLNIIEVFGGEGGGEESEISVGAIEDSFAKSAQDKSSLRSE
jgi:hypothetical protein